MANFEKAITSVLASEGYKLRFRSGYVNDPDDRGGETIAGIARNFQPGAKVWPVVDAAKKQSNFPLNLVTNPQIHGLILDFYRINFWNKIGGDGIKNEDIANLLVDAAVLEGITPAVKRAQEVVGLTKTGIATPDLITKLNSMA